MTRPSALCVILGCGGAVSGPIEQDAGDATVAKDVVAESPAPSDVTSFDCKGLQAKIDARREELKVCCPFCGSLQCSHVTKDICCPFSTTATDTSDFDAMIAQYKYYCVPACPPSPCPAVPSNNCMTVMGNQGRCQ